MPEQLPPLDTAIERLTAWIRDFGHQKQPQFIADLTVVLAAARCVSVIERKELPGEPR